MPGTVLIARNTSPESLNPIHSDAVARDYGFDGGLVPGVTDYAYLTRPVVERWGRRWLESGTAEVRLLKPVYDGQEVEVRLAGDGGLELRGPDGVCATGRAGFPSIPVELPELPAAELPPVRPAASRDVFEAHPQLGTIQHVIGEPEADAYLELIGESLPIYRAEGLVHPGLILSQANEVLMANVVLPPWIHVQSEVWNLASVPVGATLETRARVAGLELRRGHEFVELEVVILASGRGPVALVRHLAIYRIRRPAPV